MKKTIVLTILVVMTIGFSGCLMRGCNDAQQTMEKEFLPSALLKKYEYFKNLAGAIDKSRADIEVYESELATMTIVDKDDKFYYQQRKSEMLGLIANYNRLSSEYNVAMSKFNYRFTNVGSLPDSNLEPLPREFKPYITSIK